MRYVESEEARAEREFNAEANRLLEAGGCWIAAYTEDAMRKITKGCSGSLPCETCPAYISFYRIEQGYEAEPEVKNASEAIWLTCQFLSISTKYMCDGQDGDWLKEYKPEKYRENLRRQAELLNGKADEPKKKKEAAVGEQITLEMLMEVMA